MDANSNYGSVPAAYPYERDRAFNDRDRVEYELTVRQEPKQARMCGVGADRRPIDPPPIIQLRVIDSHTRQPPSPANPDADDTDPNYTNSFLQNPYYFMFASLAKPDDDAELHWLKDGKTRCTTGSVVSSLYHLKDTENRNEDAGFFVFPDLSVRTEGSYRLKLSLFEVVSNTVRHCKSIYSASFYVYTAKKFPGMEESTPLSCSLADQGIKIRIRKDIRVRKRPLAALASPPDGAPPNAGEPRKSEQDPEDDTHAQQPHSSIPSQSTSNGTTAASVSGSAVVKRARHGTLTGPLHLVSGPASAGSDGMSTHTPIQGNSHTQPSSITLAGLPAWPTSSSLDPMLGVASATPGGIELSAANALPHAHTHAHSTLSGGVGVSGQLLSGGEPSSSGSASAVGTGTVSRRTSSQALSPSASSSYPPSSSNIGGMYDRANYDYDSTNLRGTSSYDHQRSLGGTGSTSYENASGSGNGRGYDNSGARGYESGAGSGRVGFEHAQQHPRGSFDPRGGYESSQTHSRPQYSGHPHTQTHSEVHGHPPRVPFNAPYDGAQTYQDGQQQQHHGGYTHPQQTAAGYAHASSTGSHPHPPTPHHPQQGQYPPPNRSQYAGSTYPGSYARYDVGANANPNVSSNTNVNGPGAGGSGSGYYDSPPPSSSPHSHAYYASGTSGQPSQVAPPLTHGGYAPSGSAGSPYEYGAQGQGHTSGDYYSHGHTGRVISPGPNVTASVARYPGSGGAPYSSGASSAPSGWSNGAGHGHGHGQQEMIHLAPLRHAPGGVGSAGSSSSPSSPALPSASANGGYSMLSRAPFEQDPGRGVVVQGKKSVLSIGSIISDGV